MVNDSELRRGNLISYNPQLKHPTSTLPATNVEVETILSGKIGYLAPGVEHRAEPFQDDLMALQARLLSLDECEPIPLTSEVLSGCGYTMERNGVHADLPHLCLQATVEGYYLIEGDVQINPQHPLQHLHQLQNLHYDLSGKELQVNTIAVA